MWRSMRHPAGTLRCSFCGKNQNDVRKLIAGPGVYICDACVELCNDVLTEEFEEGEEARRKEGAGWGASLPDSHSRAKATVSPTASCRLCGLPAPIQDLIAVPDRGFLCLVCLGAIRAVSEQDSKD